MGEKKIVSNVLVFFFFLSFFHFFSLSFSPSCNAWDRNKKRKGERDGKGRVKGLGGGEGRMREGYIPHHEKWRNFYH